MIKFIKNTGDFFSSNYFDEDFAKKVIEKSSYAQEDIKIFNKKISALKDKYFKLKQSFLEGRLRTKDKVTETHKYHSLFLEALGYPGTKPEYDNLFHLDEKNVLPIRHILYRGEQPHLMIMEMHALIKDGEEEPDGLFEQRYNTEEEEDEQNITPQKYHRSQWKNVFEVPEGMSISPMIINKAISQLFLLDQHRRPKYILLCAGNQYFLLEQEKWFKSSYLQFDLEELFDEAALPKTRNYYALFYFLLSKEKLAPDSEIVLMEQLDEDSHKSAYEVTKDLKEGVIHAVESIANEAVSYMKDQGKEVESLNADQLKDDCLNMVYRLLFLFYAEARTDLDILPSDDPVYQQGYSLEMLRDLEQVPLISASAQNGYFFHDSLYLLFNLLSTGYNEQQAQKLDKGFKIRHLDSPLFDNANMNYLADVKLRNFVWQDVICQLSLSKKQKNKNRGRISYANLGVNQLGSVYESLLAFRGFFADRDHIEVHRKKKKNESSEQVARKDGSYLVPRDRYDDFHPDEIFWEKGATEPKRIPKDRFIYRLNGRDRQKSASYYTPEVLTQCTVKYTLKPFVEKLKEGKMKALELLELKILEPAMGAAAFQNEVINQLAELYLSYRQKEKKRNVAPDKYREELQKVKAYIALNNVYGVDLNPTAVELGKLSLWLNVIHKDMQTPFFGYRLGVGNAVVGAWLKVYPYKAFSYEPIGNTGKRAVKKAWWDTAPKHIGFKNQKKINRKANEVYHFLLPDKGMASSGGIKLLKNDYPTEAKAVSDWKKEFCLPLRKDEYIRLQNISVAIDQLLEDHYAFQQRINAQTSNKADIFGIFDDAEQVTIDVLGYKEKERLSKQRYDKNAPYYKLKLIMDYWCSLWFWDVRQAEHLPTRQQWYNDIIHILNIDMDKITTAAEQGNAASDFFQNQDVQGSFFQEPQTSLLSGYRKDSKDIRKEMAAALKKQPFSMFTNERSQIVNQLADEYRFFHYQLEFIEVFKERGGFDVAVGNPPWLKVTFEEKGLMSEAFPELEIRKTSAPQVRKLQQAYLEVKNQKELYYKEYIGTDASTSFMNAYQNYPLLKGQQTNLYKCVLENGFQWVSEKGYLGLLHPEGVYDDPKGQPLRKEMYQRLKYHFQFQNAFNLFAEVAHREKYGTHIYSGKKGKINFYSINNLFHPSTIDGCFVHQRDELCGGIKIKDEIKGSFSWNLNPHKSRVVNFQEEELSILSKAFENDSNWMGTKLVSIHSQNIISVLQKIGDFNSTVSSSENKVWSGWHETNDVNDGKIKRFTKLPDLNKYEMVYSGPHFFVGNPIYKTPREICKEKGDYDIVNVSNINEDYIPRTNYVILNIDNGGKYYLDGFIINEDDRIIYDNWMDYYKIGYRKMLGQPNERTLIGAILPPNTTYVNGVISCVFKDENYLLELMGMSSSLVLDFFIKSDSRTNLYDVTISTFPLGIPKRYLPQLFSRTLLLNCLNKYYAPLWERHWNEAYQQDSWSQAGSRLKPFSSLTAASQQTGNGRHHYGIGTSVAEPW